MNNFLITNKSNIKYLSNFSGSYGFMLITKNKKYLFTDFRYIERAKNNIKKGIIIIDSTKMWKNSDLLKEKWHKILKKHKIKLLGIEEDNLTISQFKKFRRISRIKEWKKPLKFFKSINKIQKKREIKNKNEIQAIIKAQRINEKVLKEIIKIIKKSIKIREIDLVWKIKQLGYEFGADDVAFDPIVAFGKHSAIPHHLPDKTYFKKGDIILIDMGMKYQGYCSDMTRTFFTKKPTKEESKVYNLVSEAQKKRPQ
ncbi:M24 family metallopeptidase [Patescibacteria group bacterium]